MKKFIAYLPYKPQKISRQLLTATTVLYLFCGTALAGDTSHRFTLGADAMRYTYTESTDTTPKLMSLKSNQFGGYAAYTLSQDDWFFKPEATLNYGYAKYDNWRHPQYMGASEITWLFEGRLLGGYDFKILDDLTLSPYIGIGYKHRSEDDQLTDDVAHGKRDDTERSLRVNRSWYIPIGIKARYDFTPQWFITGTIEYDHRFWGKHYDYAKQMAPSPLIFNQHKAYGIQGELMLGRHFEKNTLEVGPYFAWWKATKSNKINSKKYIRGRLGMEEEWESNGSYEPSNTICCLGLRLRVTI